MSCEYCGGGVTYLSDPVWRDNDGVELIMLRNDGQWRIEATGYYDGGYCCGSARVEIAYCPMCGRELDGGGDRGQA